MALAQTLKDYEAFGQLVRQRRVALGLSQEALAAAALGNPDRKSFVSAVENNRLTKITANSAKRLSVPLGLAREDIPASLRWTSPADPPPTEARLRALEARQHAQPTLLDDRAIARFLNTQMTDVLRISMTQVYIARLTKGLDVLRIWMGRPFGLQGLLSCYALSLLYVLAAGLVGSAFGEISLGTVALFWTQDWANAGVTAVLPYLGMLILALGLALSWYLIRPFGLHPLSRKQTATRLASVALVAGLCCGIVHYTGTQSLAAAVLFTVPSIAGISTLEPRRALFYGAAGGIAFGLMAAVSSALTDETWVLFVTSISEGVIIGGIVGSCAGLVSSLIARRLPGFRPAQLAAIGGGVATGALVSLAGIVAASQFAAVTSGALGLFAVSWVALPLANSLMDFISLGISHRLGLYVTSSRGRGLSVLVAFGLDLVLAVVLMVLTVAMVGLALDSLRWILAIETLSGTFLQTSAEDPWGQGLWLSLMALSTTVWTWLHFGGVIAPLAAGGVTGRLFEKPAARRLHLARQNHGFDLSVGLLIALRFVTFYLCWAVIALIPVFCLMRYPEIMETILGLGWRLADWMI